MLELVAVVGYIEFGTCLCLDPSVGTWNPRLESFGTNDEVCLQTKVEVSMSTF